MQTCARIDEAAEMRDKAAAIAAYARQREDRELDVWMTEIRHRASIRIGELSRDLDKAPGTRTDLFHCQCGEVFPAPVWHCADCDHHWPMDREECWNCHKGRRADEPVITGDNRLKSDVLAKAGLTVLEANRYEQLTGGATERGQVAAKGAVEAAFAKARETKTPVTVKELRSAVKEAIVAELGPAPERRQPQASPPRNPAGAACISFTSAIKTIAENETDLDEMANHFRVSNHDFLREAVTALPPSRYAMPWGWSGERSGSVFRMTPFSPKGSP